MRRVRSDVSHRMRRQPSIFSARWFRIFLGTGVALVLALLVGPRVAGWFGSDLPRSLFLLVPWSTAVKTPQPGPSAPITQTPGISSPVASSPGPAVAQGAAGATGKASGTPVDGKPGTSGRVTAGGSSTVPPSGAAAPAPASTPSRETARRAGAASAEAPVPGPLAAPPAVYWVQVGAFLDHRNADRLAERLRSEGQPAATTVFEQSRVLYRVLLGGPEGGSVPDDAIERVRGLGHPIETTGDGLAVTGPVPLRRAVETSHTLRQQGVRVRLKQEVGSATYRVVRVGSFATVAEAEAALATLTAKGVEGIVVRER